jgi:hypothetical protein
MDDLPVPIRAGVPATITDELRSAEHYARAAMSAATLRAYRSAGRHLAYRISE